MVFLRIDVCLNKCGLWLHFFLVENHTNGNKNYFSLKKTYHFMTVFRRRSYDWVQNINSVYWEIDNIAWIRHAFINLFISFWFHCMNFFLSLSLSYGRCLLLWSLPRKLLTRLLHFLSLRLLSVFASQSNSAVFFSF